MLSEVSYKQLRFEGDASPCPTARCGGRAALRTGHLDGAKLAGREGELADLVLSGAGLHAANYRANPLRRRLAAVLRATRTASVESAIACIASDRRQHRRAINSLLIGHTTPFRDVEVFTTLRSRVLPTLAEGRRGPLRVWSLGCSTGEELLSVAMLLLEREIDDGAVLRGSDCRPDAIHEARHRADTFSSAVPPAFAALRASADASRFRAIARRIEWCVEDVLSCDTNGPWDLVLCRNLSIYLEPSVTRRLWERVESCLAPGGFLVTGKAERPCGSRGLVRFAKCVYHTEETAG